MAVGGGMGVSVGVGVSVGWNCARAVWSAWVTAALMASVGGGGFEGAQEVTSTVIRQRRRKKRIGMIYRVQAAV